MWLSREQDTSNWKRLVTSVSLCWVNPSIVAASAISDANKIGRSGSDSSLAMNTKEEPTRSEPIVRFFRSQDENRKPSSESLPSSSSKSNKWTGSKSPETSPKSSRRNPLRMLSNAMDFRSRKRGSHRPKSADFERVNENPSEPQVNKSIVDSKTESGSQAAPRLPNPSLSFSYTLPNSRYSMPNLDPNDMEEALQLVKASSYLTNPRKGHRHPTPLHPLENRNSAPEIVVTNSATQQTNGGGIFYQHPQSTTTSTLRRLHHGGLEERIQRAKAKVQHGLLHMSSGSSISSSSSSSLSAFTFSQVVPAHQGLHNNGFSNTGSRTKLSTRFQTAQKLNYKLFSSGIHVKRSRTFNVSDVQDQLTAMGNSANNISNMNNSKTLPKQLRNTKLLSASRDSGEMISLSTGLYRQSSPSSISAGTVSGTSSTTSSRKSSNSSSNGVDQNLRTQINQEALDEIAAFEAFMTKFLVSHTKELNNKSPPEVKVLPTSGNTPKKKKNALRRIAAVNGEAKIQTLQRQRQLPSQESDEVTPT